MEVECSRQYCQCTNYMNMMPYRTAGQETRSDEYTDTGAQ